MRPEPLRIVVSGMVAGVPQQGGAAWAVMQWVIGLRLLGHEVILVEPVHALTAERRAYLGKVTSSFGLHRRAALVTPQRDSAGVPYADVVSFCAGADLLIDVAGMLRDFPELFEATPRRVYLDLDPGFTQIWHSQGIDMHLDGHTHFVTVGLNIGRDTCHVPTCGVHWIPTLPPVVLDLWPFAARSPLRGLTTVANWRGYGAVEHAGVHYGQKVHSWRSLLALPELVTVRCEPAVAIHSGEEKDIAALNQHGWRVLDPVSIAATPAAYRSFVQQSWGEIGVAKQGYVVSCSGWFSDRSACYLASGRPVIAQDTGWSAHLPTSQGLLPFTTLAEAASNVAEVQASYESHRRSARRTALDYFSATAVVGNVIDACVSRAPERVGS